MVEKQLDSWDMAFAARPMKSCPSVLRNRPSNQREDSSSWSQSEWSFSKLALFLYWSTSMSVLRMVCKVSMAWFIAASYNLFPISPGSGLYGTSKASSSGDRETLTPKLILRLTLALSLDLIPRVTQRQSLRLGLSLALSLTDRVTLTLT